MTNIEEQIQKIVDRNNYKMISSKGELCLIRGLDISNFRWKVDILLNNIFNGGLNEVKNAEFIVAKKKVFKKAIFTILGRQNHGIATSIDRLLNNYVYTVYATKNIQYIYVVVKTDNGVKGIEIRIY